MKNLLFLLIAFVLLTSAVPTSVRTADKAEYAKYKIEAAKIVSKRKTQIGKQTLLKVDGYYMKPDGTFTPSSKAIYWYSISAKTFTCNYNERIVSRSVVVNEPVDSTPTVREFYTNWMVNKYIYEIVRLEEAIKTFDSVYTERLVKQLNYTK